MLNGQRYAGAAVVDDEETVWESALPPGTSAQKAELIVLTRALQLGAGLVVNINTDSRYAFAMAHVHGAIYLERGLLTAEGKTIKNKKEIIELLEALHKSKQVAIIHTPGHQKGDSFEAEGNRRADQAAKAVAQQGYVLIAMPLPTLPPEPVYDSKDLEIIGKLPKVYQRGNWYYTETGEAVLASALAQELLYQLHQTTHLGKKKIKSTD